MDGRSLVYQGLPPEMRAGWDVSDRRMSGGDFYLFVGEMRADGGLGHAMSLIRQMRGADEHYACAVVLWRSHACSLAHSLVHPPPFSSVSLPSIYVPVRTSPPRSRTQRPHVFFLTTSVLLEIPEYIFLSLILPTTYLRDSGDITFLLPRCYWRYPDSFTFLLPPRPYVCDSVEGFLSFSS